MPYLGHNSKPLLMTTDLIETRDYDLGGLRFRLSQLGGKLRVQAIATAEAPAHADVERGPLREGAPSLSISAGASAGATTAPSTLGSQTPRLSPKASP
jgi:hypothetical protein